MTKWKLFTAFVNGETITYTDDKKRVFNGKIISIEREDDCRFNIVIEGEMYREVSDIGITCRVIPRTKVFVRTID